LGVEFGEFLLVFAILALEIVGFGELVKTLVQGLAVPAMPWPRMKAVLGRDLGHGGFFFVEF